LIWLSFGAALTSPFLLVRGSDRRDIHVLGFLGLLLATATTCLLLRDQSFRIHIDVKKVHFKLVIAGLDIVVLLVSP